MEATQVYIPKILSCQRRRSISRNNRSESAQFSIKLIYPYSFLSKPARSLFTTRSTFLRLYIRVYIYHCVLVTRVRVQERRCWWFTPPNRPNVTATLTIPHIVCISLSNQPQALLLHYKYRNKTNKTLLYSRENKQMRLGHDLSRDAMIVNSFIASRRDDRNSKRGLKDARNVLKKTCLQANRKPTDSLWLH